MKLLNIDDMLEAAQASKMPGLEVYVGLVESAATVLGRALAAHLNVNSGIASFEGKDLAGTCVSFWPVKDMQTCPDVLTEGDPGGDWEQSAEE